MNRHLLKYFKTVDFQTALELFMLLSLLVVWLVWPLRGTIAARNIALVTGAIASIAWLYMERPKFVIMDLLPIGFLLCVPAWLLGLYIFHPTAPSLQWEDLRGTWLRVTVEFFMAIGLGKMLLKRTQYQQYLLWVLYIWPIVILIIFISQGLFTESWFGEQIYILIFKSKIAGVYFLIWSLIFCFAYFHFEIKKKSSGKEIKRQKVAIGMLFLISLIDIFSLISLNAALVVFFAFLSIIYIFAIQCWRSYSGLQLLRTIVFALGLVCFILAAVYSDVKISRGKLTNLSEDISFILENKDSNSAWKWDGSYAGPYPPINPANGRNITNSTYERLNWLLEGVEFLKLHPLGLGYTGQAFSYYMKNQYPGSRVTKTHSGWLDFALGAGVVGLTFIFLAMILILRRSVRIILNYKQSTIIHFYIAWALLLMMLLWSVAELSDREYIEHFFFMLAFFSASNAQYDIPCDLQK